MSATARSEKIGDGDRGDNADDRDDDQKFNQREAFLAFGSHAEFLFLKRLGFPKLLAPSAFVPKVQPRKARSDG